MFGHLSATTQHLRRQAAGLVDDARVLVVDAKDLADSAVEMGHTGHLVDQAKIRGLQFGAMIKPPPRPDTIVGDGSSGELGTRIAEAGATKVFVVTTAGLAQRGTLDELVGALRAADVSVEIFDKVTPDPGYDVVMAGVQEYRSSDCDALVAVGGGSAIDAAKAIVACHSNNKTPDQLVGFLKVRKQDVPFYAVPTTAGTGSEVTIASVVTDPDKGAKYGIVSMLLVPDVVALDPRLTLTLPPRITAASGLDALTHATESFLSPIKTADSAALSLSASSTIIEHLADAVADGSDLEVRGALAQAAFDAGLAFTRAGVGYVHAISHQLGGMYHMIHGEANAMLMPHVLRAYLPNAVDDLAELAVAVGAGGDGASKAELADAYIDRVVSLNDELQIPRHAERLRTGDLPEIARRAIAENDGSYPVPRYLSQQEVEAILRELLPPESL